MATMKFALVSLTLCVLLKAYNARHLHDVSTEGSFDGRPMFETSVIQMVTKEDKIPSPPSPPSLSPHDQTTYGRTKNPPPPPKGAPSRINMINGGDKPSLKQDSSLDKTQYGREDDPRTPPSPKPNNPSGQGMYGRVNPNECTAPPKPAARILDRWHSFNYRLSTYVLTLFNIGVNGFSHKVDC